MLQLVLSVCVLEGGWGYGWGKAGGWMPLSTRLQRYRDPRHLFSFILISFFLSDLLSVFLSALSLSLFIFSRVLRDSISHFWLVRRSVCLPDKKKAPIY